MIGCKKYLGGLDALKIFATLGIVFHHYQQDFGVRFKEFNFYGGLFDFGLLVELFFMISGFLLRYNDDNEDKDYILKFTKKIIRLWPMAAISSAFVIFLGFESKILLGKWYEEISVSIWNWFISIFLLFQGNAFGDVYGLNNPVWYLCVLLICYVIYYFICFRCCNITIERIFFILMIFVGSGIIQYGISLPFATIQNGRGYVAFFIGVILCDVCRNISQKKVLLCATIGGGFFMGLLIFAYETVNANLRMILNFVIYPTIIVWAVCLEFVNRICNNKIINFFGKTSYEVYIWHYPFTLLINILAAYFSIEIKHTYGTMLAYAILIEIIAVFVYKLVENPLTKLIKAHVEKNINNKTTE